MRKLIAGMGQALGIMGVEYEGCYYITFKMSRGNDYELITALAELAEKGEVQGDALVSGKDVPVFEKYDDYVPADLLRQAYAVDKLNTVEASRRILEIRDEF
jgi:ATP-dependent Lhr-like helicase